MHIGGSYWDSSGSVWNYNGWYHIAHVRDSSNVYRLYVNGKRVNQWSSVSQSISATTGTFYIGRFTHTTGHYFTGYMQDFRITRNL